jgi:hypothetical protein
MTIDKIIHFIGQDLIKHHANQTREQLEKSKQILIKELQTPGLIPDQFLIPYCVELKYINELLK